MSLPPPLLPESILPWEGTAAVESADPGLPTLSLVIPILNAGRFLERTLRSLAGSDRLGVEVIVMDGASTDDTLVILKHYERLLDIVVSAPDCGQSDAINKGFGRASGLYLGWLNGDDLLLPNALTVIRRAAAQTAADVLVGDAAMTAEDLTIERDACFTPEMLCFERLIDWAVNHLVQPSVVFSRRAFEAVGPLDETLHYAMDADLFLAMTRRFRFVSVPERIALSVYHEAAKTRARRVESLAELAFVQARHGGLAEARRTLGLLVDLHNRILADGGRGVGVGENVLSRRLAALNAEVEANRRLLVGLDLDATP